MHKCEIFNLMNSRDFSTIKPLWVGDFGTVVMISNFFSRENFELVPALKKYFESYIKNKRRIIVVFEPICKFQNDFQNLYSLGIFYLF